MDAFVHSGLHLRRVLLARGGVVSKFLENLSYSVRQLSRPTRVTAGLPCAKIQLRELHFMVKK